MKLRSPAVTASIALALAIASASPADAVVLIDQAAVLAGGVTPGDEPGFPLDITLPGHYRLTSDLDYLEALGYSTAVTIQAPDVLLDLDGFAILSGSSAVSAIEGPEGVDGVEIVNGTVRCGEEDSTCVDLRQSAGVSLASLRFEGFGDAMNGMFCGDDCSIVDVQIATEDVVHCGDRCLVQDSDLLNFGCGVILGADSMILRTVITADGDQFEIGADSMITRSRVSGDFIVDDGVTFLESHIASFSDFGADIIRSYVRDLSGDGISGRIVNSTLEGLDSLGGEWTLVASTVSSGRLALRGSGVIQNSIIDGRLSGCSGSVSNGNNIISNQGDCTFPSDPTDQVGTDAMPIDPLLGPLEDNGGPTSTRAVLPGSPALDAIDPASCTFDDDGDPGTPEVALGSTNAASPAPGTATAMARPDATSAPSSAGRPLLTRSTSSSRSTTMRPCPTS